MQCSAVQYSTVQYNAILYRLIFDEASLVRSYPPLQRDKMLGPER
jgi:hypothetical protein